MGASSPTASPSSPALTPSWVRWIDEAVVVADVGGHRNPFGAPPWLRSLALAPRASAPRAGFGGPLLAGRSLRSGWVGSACGRCCFFGADAPSGGHLMARFSEANEVLAREIIGRYPRAKSATIPLLHLAQEQDGFVADDA